MSSHTLTLEVYSNLPLSFIPNYGQFDPKVKLYAKGSGSCIYFTLEEVVLECIQRNESSAFEQSRSQKSPDQFLSKESQEYKRLVLALQFINPNPNGEIIGQKKLKGIVNYLKGNDPSKWKTNLPTYEETQYKEIWPNIDAVFYGTRGVIKNEFHLKPGANPKDIQLKYKGIDKLTLDEEGNLHIHSALGEVVEHYPISYQMIHNKKVEVESYFTIHRDTDGKPYYGFEIGEYDTQHPLIIDPALVYSTYLGETSNADFGIAVDAGGNAYVTGSTDSTNFPTTPGSFQPVDPFPGIDAFVSKINPTGSGLVYSTYLGGNSGDTGRAITVDAGGNAYVTGSTGSANFPTTAGAFQTINPNPTFSQGFVTKLNPLGTGLVYSTFLGGTDGSGDGNGIVVDAGGNAYLTGITLATNFPTTPGAFQPNPAQPVGPFEAYVTKLNPAGSGLVYSTYLGGNSIDLGNAITVDTSGNAYVTGETFSTDFPTTPGSFQPSDPDPNPASNGFVTKLNSSGTTLVYSTYLGGNGNVDSGVGIAVDAGGNAYVTGSTNSTNFPTTPGSFQPSPPGANNTFVTKLNPTGSGLVYSTYLGGNSIQSGSGVAVDNVGNAYVTGGTFSTDFPITADAIQPSPSLNGDVFVTMLNPTGTGLIFSTYLGGSGSDVGRGIAIDGFGNTYITGSTFSTDFPTTPGSFRPSDPNPGSTDQFVAKLNLIPAPTITCPADITVSNDPMECGAVVNYPDPIVTDACPAGFTVVCNPPSGSFFPVGTTTGTCTVTDPCGGSASCMFTVTVNDTEPPTITCPANITQGNDPGQCGAVVNYPPPSVSDNCPGVMFLCSPPSGSFFPVGMTTVTCTAIDAAGNTSTCSFTVTVVDTEPPIITCSPDIMVFNDPGTSGSIVNFVPTVNDNCPGATAVCTPASGSFFPSGTTTVTCIAIDAAGNSSTCTFNVRVIVDPCRFFSSRCRRRRQF